MNMLEKTLKSNNDDCSIEFSITKQKHSMNLNLELQSKNETVIMDDQTPTPTSFFRNCEEVGLFQDLQNVNPFEETFKNALENQRNDNEQQKLRPLSMINNEDSLHTPHIFPTLEEQQQQQQNTNNLLNDSNNDLSITNFVDIPDLIDKIHNITDDTEDNKKLKEKQENLRSKLKEALNKKDKTKNDLNSNIQQTQSNLGVIFLTGNNTISTTNNELSYVTSRRKFTLKEMNRAAQIRCRNKKKLLYDKMLLDFHILRKENGILKGENTRLKKLNTHLLNIIDKIGIKKEIVTENPESEKVVKDNQIMEKKLKKLPLIAPSPKIQTLIVPSSSIPVSTVTSQVSSSILPTVKNIVPALVAPSSLIPTKTVVAPIVHSLIVPTTTKEIQPQPQPPALSLISPSQPQQIIYNLVPVKLVRTKSNKIKLKTQQTKQQTTTQQPVQEPVPIEPSVPKLIEFKRKRPSPPRILKKKFKNNVSKQ